MLYTVLPEYSPAQQIIFQNEQTAFILWQSSMLYTVTPDYIPAQHIICQNEHTAFIVQKGIFF